MALTRYDPRRVIAVTLGLAGAGAVFGGVAGATALGIALAISEGLGILKDIEVLLFPGVIGAVLGAGIAPLIGWLLLRRVPLGRAFRGLMVGTVLGGLLGWFVPISFDIFTQPIVAAAAGCLSAAILLRLKYKRGSQELTPTTADGAT